MAQIKIYGIDKELNPVKELLSKTIHEVIVKVLAFPKEKCFHRFFPMAKEDMLYGVGRSDAYSIIEIMMIEGRTTETKKQLIKSLFKAIEEKVGIAPHDVEICIQEALVSHWGFHGKTGDDVMLDYKIKI